MLRFSQYFASSCACWFATHLLCVLSLFALTIGTPKELFAQIVGSSQLVIDTTKIVPSGTNSLDARINACIGLGNNVKCDASAEPKQTILNPIVIPTMASGITLVLNMIVATPNVQMLTINGNNNDISCVQGWGSYPSSTAVPSLDASNYTVIGSGATPAILIQGNGNKFHDCYVKGSYLNTTTPPSPTSLLGDCIQVLGNGNMSPPQGNDNEIRHNLVQLCGNRGILAKDTYRTKIQDNYSVQSLAAGIQVDAGDQTDLLYQVEC